MRQSRRRHVLVCAAVVLLAGTLAARAQELRYPLNIRGQFTPQGMLVQFILPGCEAERAGLQRGDLITKVDNEVVTNQADMVRVINTSGGSVVLTVRKPTGRVVRLNLDLRGGVVGGPRRGLPAPYLLGVAGLYQPQGMLIRTVGACTPAARCGLEPNDVILRINGAFISNQRDLFTALTLSGGTVVLDVRRGRTGRLDRVTVDLKLYELGVLGDFPRQGMQIRIVGPGTAAALLGLQPGDVIVAIDNRFIRSQREFEAALRNSGGTVELAIRKWPLGVPFVLRADLVNNPLGAWCEPSPDGLRITTVTPATPADALGLERGDVILRVDNRRVRTSRQLTHALKDSGGVVSLLVRKDSTGEVLRLEAALGW